MKYELLSVYDYIAEAFLPPFTAGNVAVGERTFVDCFQNPEHPFAKNPQDYALFHLGSFEDSTAVITHLIPPRLVSGSRDASGKTPVERIVPMKGVA